MRIQAMRTLHRERGPRAGLQWRGCSPNPKVQSLHRDTRRKNSCLGPEREGSCVRALQSVEVWRAHGGGKAEWKRLTEEGISQDTLQAWALRAAPPGLAKAIVMRSLESVTDESEESKHEVQEAATQGQQTKVLKQWYCRTCRATVVGNRCPGCLHSPAPKPKPKAPADSKAGICDLRFEAEAESKNANMDGEVETGPAESRTHTSKVRQQEAGKAGMAQDFMP